MKDLKHIKPHYPPWHGFSIKEEWTEGVTSGNMSGTKHMITFLNKKSKEQTMMKWVVWDE